MGVVAKALAIGTLAAGITAGTMYLEGIFDTKTLLVAGPYAFTESFTHNSSHFVISATYKLTKVSSLFSCVYIHHYVSDDHLIEVKVHSQEPYGNPLSLKLSDHKWSHKISDFDFGNDLYFEDGKPSLSAPASKAFGLTLTDQFLKEVKELRDKKPDSLPSSLEETLTTLFHP